MTSLAARVFTVWLLLLGSAQAAEQGLLWQVSGKGVNGYLFGTMHSEDPRVTTLPAPVQQALERAETLMLELSLDAGTQLAVAQAMMLPQGSTLSDLIGKELARETERAMAGFGIPAEVTSQMQPWASVLTLSMPKMATGEVLDLLLYQQGQNSGKRFVALETPDEQMGIFTSLSVSEQKTLLSQVLKEHKTYPEMFEQLTMAYLERDLDAMVRLSEANPMSSDTELQKKMMSKLLEQRNHRMVERIIPELKQGTIFVGVGALHLPGEQGLVALLRERGYAVSALY